MVSALKKTEIQTVKEMVDMFKDTVSQSKAELDVIDEKYRKLIEEEKKNLKSQLAEATKQLKVWEKMFNSFDTTMVQEALGYEVNNTAEETEESAQESVADATVEETEPIVTDTIFPENNEPENIPEPAAVAEDAGEPATVPAPDAPAAVESSLDKEEDDEWNKRIESGELKEVEASADPEPEWPVEEKPADGQKETPVLTDGEDGWPIPEEWK